MGKGKDSDTKLMWPSGNGKDPRTKTLVGAEEAMEAYTLGAQRNTWMPETDRHHASTPTFSTFYTLTRRPKPVSYTHLRAHETDS